MLTHRVRDLARATSASSVTPDSRAARRGKVESMCIVTAQSLPARAVGTSPVS